MQRYSHSGIVPVGGAINTVLAGLAAAVLGGVVYAFLAYWLSWGPVRLLLMLVYSFAVGFAIAAVANRGKIRSPLFNTAIALVCVALGMWVYWGSYDVARNGIAVAPSAWTPAGLVRSGADLFEKGSFTMKRKQKADGWLLVFFWIAEGICVTGIVIAIARIDAERPFCETCQEWTKSEEGLLRLASDGNEPVWQEVLAGDLTALAVFERAFTDTSPQVRLDLARCPKCEHSNFVSLTAITITTDKKGKTKTRQRSLITNGAITDPEAVFLAEFSKQIKGGNEDDIDDEGEDENEVEDEGNDARAT
ncbi:MAG: hypothetical protein L0211_02310 [Planctomycetaceae bacterium]|nr:hypothetical protein [Planctomycetaceae bacterium]